MNDYRYVLVPVITLMLCQLIKFIIESVNQKKLDFKRLFSGSGGMPSSHTALTTSLLTIIGLSNGVNNPMFGIALVMFFIVAYDGMNVRLETGKQAKTINALVESIFVDEKYAKLKEQLGHKPKEVFMGIILGILTASCYYMMFI